MKIAIWLASLALALSIVGAVLTVLTVLTVLANTNTNRNVNSHGPAHPSATHSATHSAQAECLTALKALYSSLGAPGTGVFQADVNAEAFAGSIPVACTATTITHGQLMSIAATAANGG